MNETETQDVNAPETATTLGSRITELMDKMEGRQNKFLTLGILQEMADEIVTERGASLTVADLEGINDKHLAVLVASGLAMLLMGVAQGEI